MSQLPEISTSIWLVTLKLSNLNQDGGVYLPVAVLTTVLPRRFAGMALGLGLKSSPLTAFAGSTTPGAPVALGAIGAGSFSSFSSGCMYPVTVTLSPSG